MAEFASTVAYLQSHLNGNFAVKNHLESATLQVGVQLLHVIAGKVLQARAALSAGCHAVEKCLGAASCRACAKARTIKSLGTQATTTKYITKLDCAAENNQQETRYAASFGRRPPGGVFADLS